MLSKQELLRYPSNVLTRASESIRSERKNFAGRKESAAWWQSLMVLAFIYTFLELRRYSRIERM